MLNGIDDECNQSWLFFEFIDWNGGVNYYKNLFQAINDLPEKDIQPIVFCGKKRT